jgi:hypothetical protein
MHASPLHFMGYGYSGGKKQQGPVVLTDPRARKDLGSTLVVYEFTWIRLTAGFGASGVVGCTNAIHRWATWARIPG